MFVGHYGPSFAAKATEKTIPLWLLFLAVQWLDVMWSIFVLVGIEKVRIVPGFTATNPLDLYYMPYTHSLIGAILWSMAVAILYKLWFKNDGTLAPVLVGLAVFSHWLLDLFVHRQDLPLYDNSMKVGMGLWNFPTMAFALEVVFLFSGLYFYLKSTRPLGLVGRYGLLVFAVVMFFIQAYVFFGPPPASDKAAAVTALVAYLIFAAAACFLERQRAER
jgi:hypothetical protein